MIAAKPLRALPHVLPWIFAAWISSSLHAQSPCPEDSLALNVTVTTDPWGYEMYWELLALGSECGDGSALLWGGNPDVGCGEDVPGLPGNAYGNNMVISSPSVCVSVGDSLVLVHRDSFGDGGSQFSVALSGMEVYAFGGSGFGNDWVIQTQIMQGDLPCLADSIEADGPSWVGSTVEATVSPGEPSPPAWGCGSYGGWCESGLSNTRWLVWEVPSEGGVYYITTCNEGTTFDTQLAMWEVGDCLDFSTFDLINANDDIGCAFGAYRSGFLTPCFEGGETMYLQIDGYYGEVGDVEVSISSSSPEAWSVSASVQDLSCSLETNFDPNGAIYVSTNVGLGAVDWSWEGPFGFTSNDGTIAPLLPGVYEMSAAFCGESYTAEFEVEEPQPIEAELTLVPDCEAGAMTGSVSILGDQNVANASWTVGTFEANGVEVAGLPGGLCQVEVVDESGCETTEWIWVETVGVPDVDLGPDLFGCAGDAFTLLAPLGNNLSYTWTTGQSGPLVTIQTENPGTLVVGVEVSDASGCSDTDVVILTLDDCATGVDMEWPGQDWNSWAVYPNPFQHEIRVELPLNLSLSSLHVKDISGKEMPCSWSREGTLVRGSMDVSQGMYFLVCDEIPGGGVRMVRH